MRVDGPSFERVDVEVTGCCFGLLECDCYGCFGERGLHGVKLVKTWDTISSGRLGQQKHHLWIKSAIVEVRRVVHSRVPLCAIFAELHWDRHGNIHEQLV